MKMPAIIVPMSATADGIPFDSNEWLFEIKHDGYRIITYISKENVRLKTRNNVDYTQKFQLITDALKNWNDVEAIVDGEIVVLNKEGASDFHALQNYRGGEVYYYVFDLLYLNGKDYTKLPLIKRKAMLKKILPKIPLIRFCDHVIGQGIAMFEGAKELGLEGLIAKKVDSIYQPNKRSKAWLKIKAMKKGIFFIAGLTYSSAGLSSLILATAKGGNFHYAGDVGTGFDGREAKEIINTIKVEKKCPLVKEPDYNRPGRWRKKTPVHIIWCRPVLRCNVKYLERTEAGELRHASFQGLVKKMK
jgi:bifunctional non-homologous end joining protein LigD